MKKLQSFTIAVALSIGSQAQTVTNGLVAHYPLDGDAQDISPNQIHGTVYGAVAANDRNGNPNSCMYFNGLGDFIEILSNNANTPELVSVSLWVKPENRTNRHTPISKRLIHNAHPHNSYAITTTEIGPNGKWQFAVSDTISISQTTINDTNLYSLDWTHLVGTYDGNEMHLYVDGQLVSSVPKSGNVLYTNMTLRIGHAIPGTSQTDFQGWIDDIRIYNRGLSQTEIDSLFMNSPTSHTPIKSANGVRIYPNPAKNIIQIESEPLTSIQAIDMHGKRFKIQIEGRSINVSDLPKGIYIFELLDSNGKYWREKVVIGD